VGFHALRPTAAAADDPLLAAVADGDMAFQWHMDTFTLPEGAQLLVKGDAVANQAFRIGDRTWGVQFHFEVDRPEIELWFKMFSAEGDLRAIWGKSADQMLAEADRFLTDHERRGRDIFERFVRVAARS
jgi:GMP synthase (glutamine-hydrolysing)